MHMEQPNTTVFISVLMVLFPIPERNNQPSLPLSWGDSNRLLYCSQDRMHPVDHGLASTFEQLHTDFFKC